MEVAQGNSLCSYLKQTKNVIFFIHKIREQEGGTGSAWKVGNSGGGMRWGKGMGE
jgi:hypothetical protein